MRLEKGRKEKHGSAKKKHHWVIESRVKGPTNSQTYKVIGHLDKLDNLLKSAIDIYYLFKSRKKLLKSAAEMSITKCQFRSSHQEMFFENIQ